MRGSIAIILPIILFTFSTASARTWYIKPDGSGDALNIQAGIDSAGIGDTLSLEDGTYTGEGNYNISFHGKAIVVKSETDDPELCAIDCGGITHHRGFIFDSGEVSNSILQAVTIRNGNFNKYSGDTGCAGIYMASSPTISNCILRDNEASLSSQGGAMLCLGGSPTVNGCSFVGNSAYSGAAVKIENSGAKLTDCVFADNQAGLQGGAIACKQCSPEITGCQFIGNASSGMAGVLALIHASPVVTDCVFFDNEAIMSGIADCTDSSPVFRGCTFCGNSAWPGTGNLFEIVYDATPTFERCIFAFNGWGKLFECVLGGGPAGLRCCDVYGNQDSTWVSCIDDQGANFSWDPKFCNIATHDFRLESCSPCLPGQHPYGYDCGGIVGALGEGCDCGAALNSVTWGTIKSMYKEP
jgi:predicted outer membrane repeat protein